MDSFLYKKIDELLALYWLTWDYRDFLIQVIERRLVKGLQSKSDLARLLKLSPAYITKVFAKKSHLSFENFETILNYLEFPEIEILTSIDKLNLVKTDSNQLKTIIQKRIQLNFDSKTSPQEKNKFRPTRPLYFIIQQALLNNKISIEELIKVTRISKKRLEILIQEMMEFYNIKQELVNNEKIYWIDHNDFGFCELAPNTPGMRDAQFSLRRLAQNSLEMRYPINIVDESEHYVSGTFILSLNKDQLNELKFFLTRLCEKSHEVGKKTQYSCDSYTVGLTFDLFDLILK